MSRRQLDIYAIERRVGQVAFVLPLWIVQHAVLTRYVLLDWARKIGGAK